MAASLLLAACGADVAEVEGGEGTLAFSRVSTGLAHTCALAQTGSIYCWGSDETGQLGSRESMPSAIPVRANSGQRFVDLSAGALHNCALDGTGELYCWGNNNHGQLGNGTTVTLIEPVPMLSGLRFTQVASGWMHTCALSAGGVAYCWGLGGQGQLGTGRYQSELRPAPVGGALRFAQLSAGAHHTCGIALDKRVFCWGQNSHGQLGTNNLENSALPVQVIAAATSPGELQRIDAEKVAAGETHTCAMVVQRTLYCWGSSVYGELGNSYTAGAGQPGSMKPVRVGDLTVPLDVTAGAGFSCTATDGNRTYCWGRGFEGQLGNGQTRNWPNPQMVSDGVKVSPVIFRQVDASAGTHACAVTEKGAVYCWGRGETGQLGNGSTTFTTSAMRISVR